MKNKHPPSQQEVKIYFNQKGFEEKDAETFFKEFEEKNWQNSKGNSLKNWRAKANERMWQEQKDNPYLRSKSKLMFG